MPYLTLDTNENGSVVLLVDDKPFPITADGCRAAGKHIAELGSWNWLCSSSLDFPEEYGVEGLDIHELVALGHASHGA
jgi:hypothetical protein